MSRSHAPAAPTVAPDHPRETHGHSDEKARQILDGARAVFLRDGFDGASMNDIARVAGVSKGTLYVYFQSKDQLFAALIRHDKRQQAEQTCHWTDLEPSADARTALGTVGRRLLRKITHADNVAQVRTVMAVSPKFPEIGRAFWETGPSWGHARFADLLGRLMAEGRLAPIADPHRAAVHFIQLCVGDLFSRLMFSVVDGFSEAEIDEAVDAAVDIFLAVHGPRG
jgi:AcrR family transcriptional regulator